MTTLDEMAKAAYEEMLKRWWERGGNQCPALEGSWEKDDESVRESWRVAIRAALAVADMVHVDLDKAFLLLLPMDEFQELPEWRGRRMRVIDEVKPDAVTEKPACCSEWGHFKNPNANECYCGALIFNGTGISLRRRQ